MVPKGQNTAILHRPQQTKADCVLTFFTTWKAGGSQPCGLMHEAMRVMFNAIHAANRNRLTRTMLHVVTLGEPFSQAANYKSFLMMQRDD